MPGIGENGAVAGRLVFKQGIHRVGQLFQSLAGFGADGDHHQKGQVAGRYGAAQIRLIDQSNGVFLFFTQIDNVLILLGKRLGAVADEQHQVGFLHCLLGALHADGLHGVGGFPDAGGVDEPQPGGAQHHRFLHRIPGGAGDIGDDHPVVACQGIEQAGLSHVGLAHNGGGNALPENSSLAVGLQQAVQRLSIAAEIAAVVFQTEILDVLVGIIQHRVEMAAKIHQVIVNGGQLFL